MSRLNLTKKKVSSLVMKAWKSFTATVQCKIHQHNLPTTIRTATHRLTSTVRSLFRLLIPSKLWPRSLTNPSYTHNYHHIYHHHTHFRNNNFSAIQIDELYAKSKSKSTAPTNIAETSKGKKTVVEGKAAVPDKTSKSMYSVEDAWNAVVASSPQLRCVDERAEDFISNFRRDMKLQKERSILEFQEMLARST